MLEIDDIELSRGERTLVSDLGFKVMPGQLALLMGPNGTGKTTLLRAIAGLSPPSRGQIRLDGLAVERLEPAGRARIAYQAHLEGLKKDLSILENLKFISQLHSNSHSLSEVLDEVGLTGLGERTVRRLSAGQKRRVALAGLRVSGASVWLLDEPLTNLDVDGRGLVIRWIDEHLAGGGIAVVATHMADGLARPGSVLVEF